jgi:hypothetical protein
MGLLRFGSEAPSFWTRKPLRPFYCMARFGLLLGSRCSWFFLPSPQLSPGRGLLGLALRYLNYEGLLSTYCFDISFATQLLRRERMLAWVTKDPSYETPNHGIQGIFFSRRLSLGNED